MKYGLVGGTYRGTNPKTCPQRTINLWPQTISAKGESKQRRLVHVPGKRLFGTFGDAPGRALYVQDERCFAVCGGEFWEIFSDGAAVAYGSVAISDNPAVMTGNGARGHQVMVVSGGLGYIYNSATNAFVPISDPQFPTNVISCGYMSGNFVAASIDRFALSASLDGIDWGADVGQRVKAPEAITAVLFDHDVMWIGGKTQTEVWYYSGAASFPMEPVPGVFLEYGFETAYAAARVGDSIVWLGCDERGGRQVFRNQGYNAVPISHEGISSALAALPSVADARMWSYQIDNHTFAVLTIPSQALTLQYDINEQEWSELAYWNSTAGVFEADRASCHAYVFGKHLALDRQTGNIWELSMDVYADGSTPKRWLRVGPVLTDEGKTLFHHSAELDAVAGVGLTTGQGSDPKVMLRYSDDAGMTWSNESSASLGAIGNYDDRPRWNRLGSSRNRVYELTGTDPVPIAISDLLLDVTRGTH